MTQLSDVLDVDALEDQIAKRFITRRVLAGSDIAVYNYTARAASKGVWTTETRRCRGLVVDGSGRVLARPFEKFFDLAMTAWPDGECFASEKVDGSLGILYNGPDGPAITTRGDPNGWQSRAATALLRERYPKLVVPENVTWLFEIVLPENRVVIDYGDRRDLVLLAAIDIATGQDCDLPCEWTGTRLDRVAVDATSLHELVSRGDGDREGFVLHWPACGLRAKLKLPDYVRRHRLIFATSTNTIWETLAAGGDPVAEVADCPAELRRFVEKHAVQFQEHHDAAVAAARSVVGSLSAVERADRRLAAEAIKKTAQSGLAFLALDGRYDDLDVAAWRCVRPEQAEAYRTEGAGE